MKHLLRLLALLLVAGVASSQTQPLSTLPSAGPLTGTEAIPAVQPGSCVATGGTCKTTPAAINTYVNGHLTGNTTGNAATATALAAAPAQCSSNQFATGISVLGAATCSQPSAGQVTGLAASATTDVTNAANISSGTLPASRLPAFTGDCTTTIGTVATTCTKTNGVAFAASATADTTNAGNISAGTLGSARGGAGAISGVLKANGSGTVSAAAAADVVGLFSACSGAQYLGADGACHSSGVGTVTSVGLTTPSWLTVTGSPVTGSGTLAVTGTSQSANLVMASPNGAPGAMVPRAIVGADIPTLNQNTTGNAGTATALAALPTQCGGGQFATGVAASGNANCGTPAGGGNVSNSGTPTNGQIAQWTNATTIQGLATTGTGNAVLATSPALTSPSLGTPSALTLTNATGLPLASGVSGQLPVANGGTGAASLTAFDLVVGNGTSAVGLIAPSATSGVPLLSSGSAANPAFGQLNLSLGTAVVSGSLPILYGGTGATSLAAANIPVQTGAITSGHCVQWATGTSVTDSGAGCGAGGSSAFSALTTSTNTTAAMVVGTGASLATSGSGTIAATNTTGVNGAAIPTSAVVLGSNGSNQLVSATTTGSGSTVVLATSPTLVTPTLGAATATTINGSTISTSAGTVPGSTGAFTLNDCVKVGSTSPLEIADAGSACGGAGSPGGSTGQIQYNNAGSFGGIALPAGQVLAGGGPPAGTATPTLGASGTVGTLALGNATSGTVTLGTVAGALGAVTASLPANTGTLAELNLAQSWSALQTFPANDISIAGVTATGATGTGSAVFATSPTLVTPTLGAATATTVNGNTFTTGTYTLTGSAGKTLNFTNSLTLSGTDATTMTFPGTTGTVDTLNSAQTFTAAKTFTNSDILLLGSSTGATTFTSANAGASNFTATVPANTGTLAELNLSQTWTGTQTFNGTLAGTAFASPPAIGGTTPAAGSFSSLTDTGVTGSTQCLHVNTSGVVSGTGSDCGAGGSPAFSSITSATNTTAAMVVGTGASLAASGSGTIAATSLTALTGLPSIANNTILGNSSGSSAAPSAQTAANVLGVLNSTTANAQTGTTYTPVIGDANLVITMANASSNTLTIPPNASVAFPVGTTLTVEQNGAGITTVSPGAGVTLQSLQYGSSTSQTYALAGIYDFVQLRQTAANTWWVVGVGPGRMLQSGVVNLASTSFGGVTGVLPAANGGTGEAGTITGVLFGNGTSAHTAATGANVISLWTGTCSSSTFLRGDGSCQTPAGGGNVSNSGTPTSGQMAQWTSATVIQGIATTGTGNAVLATSPALTTPNLGTPSAATLTNATGLPLASGVTGALPLANGGTGTTGLTSVSTATSVTPNCTFGIVKIVASTTGTFTVNAPGTCTPFDGQRLLLKVTSPAGGTITYSWNATYKASATLALPTTSNAASLEDYFSFSWDADKSGWVFLAANQGF